MGLRMKNFNIMGGSLKNPVFRGGGVGGGGAGLFEVHTMVGLSLSNHQWGLKLSQNSVHRLQEAYKKWPKA